MKSPQAIHVYNRHRIKKKYTTKNCFQHFVWLFIRRSELFMLVMGFDKYFLAKSNMSVLFLFLFLFFILFCFVFVLYGKDHI